MHHTEGREEAQVGTDDRKLYKELAELARYIEGTMKSVNSMQRPLESVSSSLPQATEHLLDLRRLTEEATHKVMGETEALQENHTKIVKLLTLVQASKTVAAVASQLGDIRNLVADDDRRLTEIFQALSFQDLLAQRINKLMTVLQEVEHKLLKLLVIFGSRQNGLVATDDGKTGEMLKWLEQSKTTALKQDLVDDVLGQLGFN